jgi:hypothetical protein
VPLIVSVVRSFVVVLSGLALPAVVWAQAPAAKAPTCTSLFTAAELAQTVGGGFEDMGPKERSPGETECAWMARGGSKGFQTVSVQFYDRRAIKDANQTPAAFYETVVSGAEGMASGKRQPLPGIGQQAAFVPTDPQALAVVLRADGVARIVGNNISKAQITAIAKAIAAP